MIHKPHNIRQLRGVIFCKRQGLEKLLAEWKILLIHLALHHVALIFCQETGGQDYYTLNVCVVLTFNIGGFKTYFPLIFINLWNGTRSSLGSGMENMLTSFKLTAMFQKRFFRWSGTSNWNLSNSLTHNAWTVIPSSPSRHISSRMISAKFTPGSAMVVNLNIIRHCKTITYYNYNVLIFDWCIYKTCNSLKKSNEWHVRMKKEETWKL